MSVGPVPNLSGAVNTASASICCAALQDSGNGYIALGPSGAAAHGCTCNVPSSGGDSGDCCTNGNGNGNCGNGSGNINPQIYGAGAPRSPSLDDYKICFLGEATWNQCTCSWDWGPGTPANAPAGAFQPIPPSGAYHGSPLLAPPCAKVTPPPPPPVGAITPPPVPSSGFGFSIILDEEFPFAGN